MGCSQAKATKPSGAGVPATSAEAPLTLLSPSRSQKQNAKVDTIKDVDHQEETANCSEVSATVQEDGKNWPLRVKALRVFAMADRTVQGLLDVNQLAGADDVATSVDMLQSVIDDSDSGLLSMSQWLRSVKKLAEEDEAKASLFLDLCERHIGHQKENWPLRDEALQVFRMGDRNGDGQLDMNELTEIRCGAEAAQLMLAKIDIDKNGLVSKGEWLAYVKRMAGHDEKSAAAILELYRNHLSHSTNTADAYDAAKSALDTLVEESNVGPNPRWWACC